MTTPNRRRHGRMLAGVATLTALGLAAMSGTAAADATGTVAITDTTIAPGDATTATIDVTFGTGIIGEMYFKVVPVGATTGTMTLAWVSNSGAIHNCVEIDATEFDCTWNTPANPQTGSLNVTLTASADASGTWSLQAQEFWAPDGQTPAVVNTIDSDDVTVSVPVVTDPVSTDPATTGAGSGGALPNTGSSDTTPWVAAGLVAAGGFVMAGTRRRGRTAQG